MGLEKIVNVKNVMTVAGGVLGYVAAPLLIPYSASYAYAAATRFTTTITGAYVGSLFGSYQKSAHGNASAH